VQHMILSLSKRVRGGLSIHSLSENWLEGETCWASNNICNKNFCCI